MKFSTLLTIAVLLLGVVTLKAQDENVTFTDEFNGSVSYFIDGAAMDFSKKPEGSIWHGFVYNSGLSNGEHPCVVTKVVSGDSVLVFQTKDGGFEGDHDSGAVLYRNIENGANFDAQFKLVGGDFTTFLGPDLFKYHNSAGIICRNAATKEVYDAVYCMFFDLWNTHHMIKSMDNGVQTELGVSKVDTVAIHYSIAEYPWLRLKKVGTLFTAYTSKNGKDWIETKSVDRPDFEGVNMQVGLTQCNFYSHNTEWAWIEDATYYTEAKFAHYQITTELSGVPSANNEAKNGNKVSAFYNAGNIVVKSAGAAVSKISLYSIDGKLISSTSNLNVHAYSIPVSQKGIYIVSAETAFGTKVHKVSVNQ